MFVVIVEYIDVPVYTTRTRFGISVTTISYVTYESYRLAVI